MDIADNDNNKDIQMGLLKLFNVVFTQNTQTECRNFLCHRNMSVSAL